MAVGLADRARVERAALGDRELQLDQVDAVDQLGDRVLDLEAGVHLQEEEPVGRRVVEELDGAGAAVADRLRRPRGPPRAARARVSSGRPGAGASSTTFWWRRWTEQSRSPSTRTPPRVADDLHLDVAAVLDVRLDEDGAVAERRRRLGLGRGDLGGQVGEGAHDAHAAATTDHA